LDFDEVDVIIGVYIVNCERIGIGIHLQIGHVIGGQIDLLMVYHIGEWWGRRWLVRRRTRRNRTQTHVLATATHR
jgi:hypothetical protein